MHVTKVQHNFRIIIFLITFKAEATDFEVRLKSEKVHQAQLCIFFIYLDSMLSIFWILRVNFLKL